MDQIKEHELGGACSTYKSRRKMCAESWFGNTKTPLEKLGRKRQDNFPQDVRLEMEWTGLTLFRTEITDRLL
jgi:hypothetical protein